MLIKVGTSSTDNSNVFVDFDAIIGISVLGATALSDGTCQESSTIICTKAGLSDFLVNETPDQVFEGISRIIRESEEPLVAPFVATEEES